MILKIITGEKTNKQQQRNKKKNIPKLSTLQGTVHNAIGN